MGDWLNDFDAVNNILWVFGAPGAGKSTIATTIAKEFTDTAPFCARFFCKRDDVRLRDPSQIWRTLAYSLASKHDGVKAALMLALSERKGDPNDYSVLEQFQKFIKTPLQTDRNETGFRSHKPPYPLIIIDALDECYSANDNSWESLLESLVCWAELPREFKLIVTSRRLGDLHKLSKASCQIDLTTGDDVSDKSTSDIRNFFITRFAAIREAFGLPLDWPSEEIERMTHFAAGLFIWADMVVKHVGQRTAGSDPVERLEGVLSDIDVHPGNQRGEINVDDRRIDHLYARILLEAFRHSKSRERDKAKRILAAVMLAKAPLLKSDLTELLSTDPRDARSIRASIELTIEQLSPIINDELRVCHKTVSDFLLSRDSSAAAMEFVIENWNRQPVNARVNEHHPSFILDCQVENRNLALSCLHLAGRNLSLDVPSIAELLKQSNSLLYARQYWVEHLEDAGDNWIPDLKGLKDAMEVAYGRFKRYGREFMLASDEAILLRDRLRDTAELASRCIEHNLGNSFCSYWGIG